MPAPRKTLPVKAKLFRGLADPSRLAILEALGNGPRNVTQVVARTGLSQPNASMHLDCLRCCGLVVREPRGRFTYYRIASPKILRILRSAEDALGEVFDRVAECERFAEGLRR